MGRLALTCAQGPSFAFQGAANRSDRIVDWQRHVAALRRHKWFILLVTALGTAGGVAASRLHESVYEAEAALWIDVSSEAGGAGDSTGFAEPPRSNRWVELLKTHLVLDSVAADRLLHLSLRSLDDAPAFAGFGLNGHFRAGTYRLAVARDGKTIELYTVLGQLLQSGVPGDSVGQARGFGWAPPTHALWPGRVIEFTVEAPRDVADRLREQLEIRTDENGNFVRLKLSGSDRYEVVDVLNAVSGRYAGLIRSLKREKLEKLTHMLDVQLERAEHDLRAAEAELARAPLPARPRQGASPTPFGDLTDPSDANLVRMRIEEEELRRDREAIEGVLAQADPSSIEALGMIAAVQRDDELAAALRALTERRAQMYALGRHFGEVESPIRSELRAIRALEAQTIPRLARRLAAQLRERELELGQLVASTSSTPSRAPPELAEWERLERRVEMAADLFVTLHARYAESLVAAASNTPEVRILDPAVAPRRPSNWGERPLIILLAFAATLSLAAAGAILFGSVAARRVQPDAEQVSEELRLAVLGTVPHLQRQGGPPGLESARHVVDAASSSPHGEARDGEAGISNTPLRRWGPALRGTTEQLVIYWRQLSSGTRRFPIFEARPQPMSDVSVTEEDRSDVANLPKLDLGLIEDVPNSSAAERRLLGDTAESRQPGDGDSPPGSGQAQQGPASQENGRESLHRRHQQSIQRRLWSLRT